MSLATNKLIMQQNYLLCVSNQITSKLSFQIFVFGKHVIPVVDKCKYLGIIVNEANCDGDLKRQMRKYYANMNISFSALNINYSGLIRETP